MRYCGKYLGCIVGSMSCFTKLVVLCVIDPSCCFVSRTLFLFKILLKKGEFVLLDLLCVLRGAAKSSLTLMVNISTEQRLMCTVKMTWCTPRGFCVCVCARIKYCRGMRLFHVSSYKRIYFPGSIRYQSVCVRACS